VVKATEKLEGSQ